VGNISCHLKEYNKSSFKIQNLCILVENVKESLSQLIQRRVRELNISKAEAARRCGITRSYFGNMANQTAPTESGQYEPSPEVVAGLSKGLEVSEIEILDSIGYIGHSGKDAERVELEAMYRKRKNLSPARREAFSRILDMVDRELDRLYEEEMAEKAKANGQNNGQ
jgi:transcriptional regulator with XRE-family HTH domain